MFLSTLNISCCIFSGYSSVPFFLGDTGGSGFQFGGIFLAVDGFSFFWRFSSFFAVPGTSKFAGIFFGGLKYDGFFQAVPGTAKFGGTFPGTAIFDVTFMAVMKFGTTSGGSSEVCRC